MSSPFAKKFCGKKSALTYGKGPLHNEKGKKINQHSAKDARSILDKNEQGLLKNPLLPIEKRALEETAKG